MEKLPSVKAHQGTSNQISYYLLPSGLSRDNLQHCVGDFARLLVAQFTINEVMSYECLLM